METIAITPPYFYPHEAEAITAMLRWGEVSRVHLRKPGCEAESMAALIARIPSELRGRISLHDHHELAATYGVGGVHLNSRNPQAPDGWTGLVSRSLHSVDELRAHAADYDYVFVSPVYPSISKPGYKPQFTVDELRPYLGNRVYALGGVTPARLAELEAAGFGGAAMLGALWRAVVRPDHFRLQFISHGDSADAQLQGIEAVLQGGCRWVQLRMKDAPQATVAEVGRKAAELCRRFGATFIIDDHVELVHLLGADGVHLGKNDMQPDEARRLLGPAKIIGSTANTLGDIRAAAAAGADYIGLGPFRFTTTKKNLSPVLGLEGYRSIIAAARAEGIALPIVAIGGITACDVAPIRQAGAAGIAVSGSILRAENPIEETKKFI